MFKWDKQITTEKGGKGEVVFKTKHLLPKIFGCRVDLHKMYRADEPGRFHSHPAWAFRIILWGGYIEELVMGVKVKWFPGCMGTIAPTYYHRIDELLNGKYSLSLWIRGPIVQNTHVVEKQRREGVVFGSG